METTPHHALVDLLLSFEREALFAFLRRYAETAGLVDRITLPATWLAITDEVARLLAQDGLLTDAFFERVVEEKVTHADRVRAVQAAFAASLPAAGARRGARGPGPLLYGLPRPSQVFEGREAALETLHGALSAGGKAALVAVQGLGGIGKTELAVQYALAHKDDYPGGIFLLNAEGDAPARCLVDLLQEAALGVHQGDGSTERQIQGARALLGRRRALLILDNVTNIRDLPDACPVGDLCRVLVTTRRVVRRGLFTPIRVEELSPAAALVVLQQLAPEQTSGENEADAVYLADLVGHLPLALQMLGAHLAEEEIPAGELVAVIEAKAEGMPAALREPPNTDAAPTAVRTTVWATFATSWARLSHEELLLLMLACRFAPTPFPERLLEGAARWLGTLESGQEEPAEEAPRWFAAGLKRLWRRHLLLDDEERGWLRVHRLVRGFVREQMGDAALEGAFVREMIRVCQREMRITKLPFGVAMREHLEIAHERIVVVLGKHMDIIWPATALGRLGQWTADIESAERWYRAALRLGGEDHQKHPIMLNNLGRCLHIKGDLSGAESLYRRALAISEATLDEAHPDVAKTLNNLGCLLYKLGNRAEALIRLNRALAIAQASFPAGHPDIHLYQENLAIARAKLF